MYIHTDVYYIFSTHVYLVIQCITSGILVEHTCYYIHVKLACATAWRFTVSPQCNIQLEWELIFFLCVCVQAQHLDDEY